MTTAEQLIEELIDESVVSEVIKPILTDLRAVAKQSSGTLRTIKKDSVEIVVNKKAMSQLIRDLESGDPPYDVEKKSDTVLLVKNLT